MDEPPLNTDSPDRVFAALLREASLAAKMLGNGATLLRDVYPGRAGSLGIALFSLSIGMERAAKLAFVVDYRLQNGVRFPTDRELRDLGHDLECLFERVVEIGRRRLSPEDMLELPEEPIHHAIIGTLSEFARCTRYYNLDLVVQGKNASLSSPEVAWFHRIGKLILAKHYEVKRRERDKGFAENFGGALDRSGSVVRVMASGGGWVSNSVELIQNEQETELVQRWAQFYVLQVVRFIAKTLATVESAAHQIGLESIPCFGELFAVFFNDDAYFKRRKTWNT